MNGIKNHRNEETQIVEESTAILNWLVKRIKSNQHSQATKIPKCIDGNKYDTKTKRSGLTDAIVTSTSQPTVLNKTNVNIKHKSVTQDEKIVQCRKIWIESCIKERSSKKSTYKKTGAAWVRPEPSTSKFVVEEENITKEKLDEIFKEMESFMLPPLRPIETVCLDIRLK
uniref:uncharacterized protein LOC104266164 n=1 Tax=Ciona intestinalis TaxID=7719 RepID=UPI000EF4C3CD|nr:uncharacterized protein LOC104266164 [Ciona intestinalis]|eukprot:XP_026692141.1 uncharacterized protein LOC104266164 [Ciona intestinalis]